jgi:hypothetical protein
MFAQQICVRLSQPEAIDGHDLPVVLWSYVVAGVVRDVFVCEGRGGGGEGQGGLSAGLRP